MINAAHIVNHVQELISSRTKHQPPRCSHANMMMKNAGVHEINNNPFFSSCFGGGSFDHFHNLRQPGTISSRLLCFTVSIGECPPTVFALMQSCCC